MVMKREILLVDDERIVLQSLSRLLDTAGYAVRMVANGMRALEEVRLRRPDLVLLDVMMPRTGGLDVCRELRRMDPSLPIAFLTALETPEDEIRGLTAGGDAYIAKSEPDAVLLARIAALLRPRAPEAAEPVFPFGSWEVSGGALTMRMPGGDAVPLTERELYLLRLFSQHPHEVFTRDTLVTRLWGAASDRVSDNALNVILYSLRKKLGEQGDRIVVLRGIGYSYRPDAR